MSAELTLHLIEHANMDVQTARTIAAEATSAAELALALVEQGFPVAEARAIAADAPLGRDTVRVAPSRIEQKPGGEVRAEGVVIHDDAEHAFRFYQPVVGADGLTDAQRSAVQTGVGLCRNCQQPKDNHLPGCALYSGEDPKAMTKSPLPPAV